MRKKRNYKWQTIGYFVYLTKCCTLSEWASVCQREDNGKVHKLLTLAQPRRIASYLSIWLFACLFVCPSVVFSFLLFQLQQQLARSFIFRVSKNTKMQSNPIGRKEICCYFVNFAICLRHSADSETFIYFYQCYSICIIHFYIFGSAFATDDRDAANCFIIILCV